jgi:N-carbamoylputrescine amidase
MPRLVKVAATQFSCSADFAANTASGVAAVRDAASQGANIILLQELFQSLYFCQVTDA